MLQNRRVDVIILEQCTHNLLVTTVDQLPVRRKQLPPNRSSSYRKYKLRLLFSDQDFSGHFPAALRESRLPLL